MPFYEYQCKSCGHELEAMQKVSDAALKKCPHCGKSQLTRLMSAPVFRLKGGGWYETDFKGKDKDNQRNLADRPEDSSKDKSADSKPADDKATESKTADSKADATTKESSPSKEKAPDKPAEKASGSGGGKTAPAKRLARTGSPKKKPVKVKRRR
jgi:putative FmdB family regulatory protein